MGEHPRKIAGAPLRDLLVDLVGPDLQRGRVGRLEQRMEESASGQGARIGRLEQELEGVRATVQGLTLFRAKVMALVGAALALGALAGKVWL